MDDPPRRMAERDAIDEQELRRRYLAAVKARAEVRRLRPPAVQVNIGDQ